MRCGNSGKNKRPERRGKVQLINAVNICHKLRKPLGAKKNEFTPEDRAAITKLYADFEENEICQIYDNTEFVYREYTVMQPLQRSYGITKERIDTMLMNGALSGVYDEAKVYALENTTDKLSAKDEKKLVDYRAGKPLYDEIVNRLKEYISETVWKSPEAFAPVLNRVLGGLGIDKKLMDRIADGLSVMDKTAEIQKDRKGRVLFDKATKDTETVKYSEDIETYMQREVLPHIPDAQWFWEEDVSAKNPVIKTGAEIPFTRYFYQYQEPEASEDLAKEFMELEQSVAGRVATLFR